MGETISAFLTGMRTQTDPPVATGEPAPSSPPATLDKSPRPSWNDTFNIYMTLPDGGDASQPLVYKGLAPGLAGVYRIDFSLVFFIPGPVRQIFLRRRLCPLMFGGCSSFENTPSRFPDVVA
jgi:hypothetical protein